jgi:hypothetical protein
MQTLSEPDRAKRLIRRALIKAAREIDSVRQQNLAVHIHNVRVKATRSSNG